MINVEKLGRRPWVQWLTWPAGKLMASPLRRWIMNPEHLLQKAHLEPGLKVLEVGCGTGFFTLPAARMLQPGGSLVALDANLGFTEQTQLALKRANLPDVQVYQRDGLNTQFPNETFDLVLLFGVIPFPTLPLKYLLPEMARILVPNGRLAIWLYPPKINNWVAAQVNHSDFFTLVEDGHSVFNYRKQL